MAAPEPYRTVSGSIHLPATLDSLSEIRDFIEAAAHRAGLDKKRGYRLALAVDEIATNVILHGYEENGLQGDVTVHVELTDDELTVVLEDEAVPFDPRTLAEPDNLDAPLEERGIGGLGVFLTLRGVDVFEYAYENGKNRNQFTMHRREPEHGGS